MMSILDGTLGPSGGRTTALAARRSAARLRGITAQPCRRDTRWLSARSRFRSWELSMVASWRTEEGNDSRPQARDCGLRWADKPCSKEFQDTERVGGIRPSYS